MNEEAKLDVIMPALAEKQAAHGMQLAVKCSCLRLVAADIPAPNPTDAEMDDPCLILRRMEKKDAQALASFWAQHAALGHQPEPWLVEIAEPAK